MASVFECRRCNALTYSASRAAAAACERCGSPLMRVLDEVSFAAAEVSPRTPSGGDHCMTLVAGIDDAARVACGFIADGLRAGERVVAWLPQAVCSRIEAELSEDELSRLRMIDAEEIYTQPFDAAALIEKVREIARSEDTPLRVVGGPMGDPTRIAPASEWQRYETLAHELCIDEVMTGLCVWEEPAMPEDVLAIIKRAHSLAERDEAMRRNPDFVWAAS